MSAQYEIYLDEFHVIGLEVDRDGSAYWSGGRGEPWSLEVDWDPTFTVVYANKITEDGDKPFRPTITQIMSACDKAIDKYWDEWNDSEY